MYFQEDLEWLSSQIAGLTDQHEVLTVSDFSEKFRYLPSSVTPDPGYYSYSKTPYLREIADCFSIDSPVKEVALMKAAQIGATVGVIENVLLYLISHVTDAPAMLLTADDDLAKTRKEQYVMPMLENSGFSEKIQAAESGNRRKTGDVGNRLSWAGGGFCIFQGARSASKLRSVSIRYMLMDEPDGYPLEVGSDGSPIKLAYARTKAFEQSRKVLYCSTPTTVENSVIKRQYAIGDKRKYYVPCIHCGHAQVLNMFRDGKISFAYETDSGVLIPDSVRYRCEACEHEHFESDKTEILSAGEWKKTQESQNATYQSYHINALYSPPGMMSWASCLSEYLQAYDQETSTVKSPGDYQTFFNNVLGLPYEATRNVIDMRAASTHRRRSYYMGQVPNSFAMEFCESEILFISAHVDVHKRNLTCNIFGWTKGARCFLIDSFLIEYDDCEDIDSPAWSDLRDFIEMKKYESDDGKKYPVAYVFIDAGYATQTVNSFCAQFSESVYPTIGRDRPSKSQTVKEFDQYHNKVGGLSYRITVDHYKDFLSTVLTRQWDGISQQPDFHFNAPDDTSDALLRQLTVERRMEKKTERGATVSFWHRGSSTVRNELWDCLVSGYCLIDMLAYGHAISEENELDGVDYPGFWDYTINNPYYE